MNENITSNSTYRAPAFAGRLLINEEGNIIRRRDFAR